MLDASEPVPRLLAWILKVDKSHKPSFPGMALIHNYSFNAFGRLRILNKKYFDEKISQIL